MPGFVRIEVRRAVTTEWRIGGKVGDLFVLARQRGGLESLKLLNVPC